MATGFTGRLARVPLPVWIVVAMTIATAVYQYPTYHLPGWAIIPYTAGITLLSAGILLGHRWAFIFDFATVWVFPLETALGIKAPLHGTTLSVLHAVAVVLLGISWRFYWRQNTLPS